MRWLADSVMFLAVRYIRLVNYKRSVAGANTPNQAPTDTARPGARLVVRRIIRNRMVDAVLRSDTLHEMADQPTLARVPAFRIIPVVWSPDLCPDLAGHGETCLETVSLGAGIPAGQGAGVSSTICLGTGMSSLASKSR